MTSAKPMTVKCQKARWGGLAVLALLTLTPTVGMANGSLSVSEDVFLPQTSVAGDALAPESSAPLPIADVQAPAGPVAADSSERERQCASAQDPATGTGAALRVLPGDLISQDLDLWAQQWGYTVSWEIPQIRAEGPLTLDRGFTGTLMALKGALRVNDINIDISVYENCVVRIVEIK